jgi:hypothetical protein
LQLEEDDRVDRGATPLGVQLLRPVPHESEIEPGLKMTIEVVLQDQVRE